LNHAYLGLGSNLGDRLGFLRRAVDLLRRAGDITAVSPVYETAPSGYLNQPSFLNAACRLSTNMPPVDLLKSVKSIEMELGRTPTHLNGPREIDIDILLYDDVSLETRELTIPHPRLIDRAFALVPLSVIAPDVMHPVSGKTIQYLADQLDKKDVVLTNLVIVKP
jgi:2-amino-4-hydroxy-6-hydroxymethyldihydropteridine diphosphokinase